MNDPFQEPRPSRSVGTLARMVAIPLFFGLLFSFAIILLQWAQTEKARWFYIGLDGMQSYLFYAAGGFVAMLIAYVVFRPKRRTLVAGAVAGMALVMAAAQCVRIESFRGDRTPRFVWSWTPTVEQEVSKYLTANKGRMVSAARLAYDRIAPTGNDYPGFMGPERNARLEGLPLSSRWESQPPRLLWHHPIGLGWASFAVQGRVAVTLEQRDENECVVCYDLLTGEELWSHAENVRFRNEHGDGPRTTPCIDGDRVYTCGGTGLVVCLDLASGSLLWKTDLLAQANAQPPYFGWSCSPLVSQSELIVTPGITPGGTIVGLDLETGVERWRGGDDTTSYASPIAATLCGELQFLSFNGEGLRSFARGGESLWFQPWLTQGDSRVNVAQPVVLDRGGTSKGERARVLISSGYEMGTTLLEIFKEEGQWKVEPLWKSKHLKSKFSNFVVHREHIYGFDNGLLTCLRLADGERTWKKGRYGHGQLMLVDDRLLIQCESGEIALVDTNPDQLNEVARFRALEDKTWNHPALAGNILVVRNNHEAAAYELPTATTEH